MMFAIGAVAMIFTKALALMDIYFGLFAILSGYTLPIELLPTWLADLAPYTPFPTLLAYPVSIAIDASLGSGGAMQLVGLQCVWTATMIAVAMVIWTRGLRRFEAVGG